MRLRISRTFRERSKKAVSLYLVLTLLFEVAFPSASFALTSGPSQPEVQSFEPVGTSQMVDPFSGDFTYNIPLLDIDGYPVNISYHSGITMDQEASWVGLGWNINPGVINRGMRGIPDDFNGENIVKEYNMKPNRTFGLTLGVGIEFLGLDKVVDLGISSDITVRFNNYTGVGVDQTIAGNISVGSPGKGAFTGSLGLTSSSDNGLTIQPNVGFSATMKKGDDQTKLGLSIGSSFNSRAGLQQLTIGASIQHSSEKHDSYEGSKSFSSSFNFGMPTYVPQLTLPFSSLAISASFKLGAEIEGVAPYARVAGMYSCQKLSQNTVSQPAYGYLNADEGVKYGNAVMDFNREKDAPFSMSTPGLAVPNFTYDLLSVSGQGVSGSYRPFRSDFGQVFDPYVSNTSLSGSIGVEIGLGTTFHAGVDLSVTDVTSESGRWDNNDGSNAAHSTNHFTQSSANPSYERYYYKEASEKSVDADPTFLQRAGNFQAERYNLNQVSQFNTVATSNFASGGGASGTRAARERRSQAIEFLTRDEVNKKYGLNYASNLYSGARPYHTAEISSVSPDGKRYVYGIAAYNTKQEETTFAVGEDETNSGGRLNGVNCYTGLIKYGTGDNSLGNSQGVDNYFSNTKLPPFAHSYLLTAVLSADYVDADTIKGPSVGDLGTYTKFNYTRSYSDYKWRTPYDSASHNEGLKWTPQDDKANYVYGEKEVWYLSSIETKNYIGIFDLENSRHDGYEVSGKDGGRGSRNLPLLRKISLYTKANYNAHAANSSIALIPLKEVHFEYDYSLCSGIPSSDNGTGKLTLRKVSFTYQDSKKGRLSPYQFSYSYNPNYNPKAYDRWGNYKPQDAAITHNLTGCDPGSQGVSNSEFPYAEQNKTNADLYARAWVMDTVKLPSGGKIVVDYESDDYGYVQNKQACQMFKIIGLSSSKTIIDTARTMDSVATRGMPDNSRYFVIRLPKTASSNTDFYNQYIKGLDFIYFRFLYQMKGTTYEYVPGYIPKDHYAEYGIYPGGKYAYIKFSDAHTKSSGGHTISPVTLAAIQYGRLNEAKNVWQDNITITSGSSFGEQFLKSLIQSNFLSNIVDAIKGPNEALFTNHSCCQNFYLNKSWIRLNNPDQHKLGGGSRVKRIAAHDEWDVMTGSAMTDFSYGQEYSYNNDDNTSSGVASYEPSIGGEENPWHTPVFFDVTHLWAPNDENYMEEPFGEAFFPSPSVGYGRVTVANLKYSGVTKHATGKVVHEFWTGKDFPTITSRTDLQAIREKTDPLSISSFLSIDVKDYMTVGQGYYIELNDMHGKPKGEKVYQEGISVPITSVEYDYKKTNYQNGSFKLDNGAQVVSPTGAVSTKNVGVFFDFITDFRQQHSSVISGSVNINLDAIFIVLGVLPIPSIWPGYSSEDTRFRSTVSTKVVQRFGLLEKTIAKDLGSTVETDNLAYDSETGDVILTKTTTDYNDPIYSLSYPAYWYYDGMGPAYKNIGISMSGISFTTGSATIPSASTYFAPGDEIEMHGSGGSENKAWILSVSNTAITVELKDGSLPSGTYGIKVIRSGRRNMQSEKMATITSLKNPISGINSNVYEKVVTASGVEFSEFWSIFCECSTSGYSGADPSASYVTGARGNWRKKRSYAYLTGRTQSSFDGNTNTRKDGVFTSYNPLYKKSGSHWQLDTVNWTFTSKVTIMNPNGQELENQDPLGRYSAATYGYNQTFATAVAANSRYRELGFDNVEEYGSLSCTDNHFKFAGPPIDSSQAHTGRKSIKVSSGTSVKMIKVLNTSTCTNEDNCDITYSSSNTDTPGVKSYTFSGSGATSPVTITWLVTNGNPIVTLNMGDVVINTNGAGSAWSVIINVSGSGGCTKSFSIGNISN
jgi:hypothetical protein